MRIQVINPNTSIEMTRQIGEVARAAMSAGTEINAVCPAHGPESIESHVDEVLAGAAVLDRIAEGVAAGFDAHIIACFGDPALLAARELARGPVIGIAEAAMHAATLVATRFSIVTSLGRTAIQAEELLLRYGFERHCRRIRAVDLPVLELAEEDGCSAAEQIAKECRRARDEDAIGAIVLGCAGMGMHAAPLSAELGLPVIDGVGVAVRMAEALVGAGLFTSKHGDLAAPPPKHYTGRYAHWSAA
ncbi:aspartate/glutamate racemase family protein [Acidihalobacter ferrooxydans]|uniref:Asp/Glu/hydantoin racemase n=1 Tax=Acidihalobacter ferrooxydans TaxID=1765967 RepID=A0A1P8UIU4_9GAMM|nr:aspartate/glutamate racemase family protein [Acidihalobacter ferrooxydans]APZ43752.1 Asp/Glu/hydantoin racemase [Acidihalobacter ferrooxydans]